ncbi:protein OSCP1-like [Macrosteles quadrilineatus]|uniref:protein OSCP1-like n=1 Tax=Macrosteles quadrilineatus TaxID=74068 RepID=UPI0023E17251|nr:protein OSCP1-like [Macrosteles quadrilineatus]
MARYSLPLLFLNLGGEMVYILDQRLRAQQVPGDKAKKVLVDIVGIMLNQRFLEELFKPQEVYNKDALRSVFHDLAHASIMRLSDDSMGKLYDLMRMVFKYQLFAAAHPKDLVLITLNHLDSIRNLVNNQAIHKQLDNAYFLLIKTYGQMGNGELQRLRYHILNFFQDMRIRVSIFMRQSLQNSSGCFVISPSCVIPYGNEIPGTIRVYSNDGCIQDLCTFTSGGEYSQASDVGSTELRGTRHTVLGTNVYSLSGRVTTEETQVMDPADSEDYRQELSLLAKQLLGSVTPSSQEHIRLDLFLDQDGNTLEANSPVKLDVTRTEAEPLYTESLHKVMTEMTVSGPMSDQSNVNVVDLLDKFL